MIELAPSVLSADFARLGQQVTEVLECGVGRIHCDVMDGHFVPNISFGPAVVATVSPLAKQFNAVVEVHLMITQPERYIEDFVRAGADLVLVHVETCVHLHRTVQLIRQHGAAAGVVLNPATSLMTLDEILPYVEQVLVMTVNPGFGGQEFIPTSLAKIRQLKSILQERKLSKVRIEVDGGIHTQTIRDVEEAGAQIAVAGTAVFEGQGTIAANIDSLRTAGKAAR